MLKRKPGLLTIAFLVVTLISTSCIADQESHCRDVVDNQHSVARLWNEVLLDAIRRDFPAPTVHARNLFHVSAAMWDAWAAFEPQATGYFLDEVHEDRNIEGAREEAMSYAAYRILKHRYSQAAGVRETSRQLDQLMAALCFPTDTITTDGNSPAAFGNRIAERVIEFGRTDGAKESHGYLADYTPSNPPLQVAEVGTDLLDANRWQPLDLNVAIAQNNLPTAAGVQQYVGPHWGFVTGFALDPDPEGLPIDPGPPPFIGDPVSDQFFKSAVVEVIAASGSLDPTDGQRIDISPRSFGNNTLGTNNGTGHHINPVTGQAYAPNEALQGDYGRAIAEFWADGPGSETPPGHWNTLANTVSDHPSIDRRIGGEGQPVGRLEWDTKMYFVLNGALQDAAIAAWGAKAYYDYARPISMIRHMGGLGQSTDSSAPSYDVSGLPLVPGLIEVITYETGQGRHANLAESVGDIAVWAWTGPTAQARTVDWIRAVEWVPYQRDTFVTPAFPGYVSGHSAFSRAAAEVLTAYTGSQYFPGGIGEWTINADSLEFEAGPSQPVTLQWATYQDAADQAGLSRIYGGIHVQADDLAGRVIGAECGLSAWSLAQVFWDQG